MKKTISVTLNGIVFIIEEDAMQKLSAYFDSIRKYYGTDGEEIMSDIEANIAEKLKDKNNGSARVITIDNVEEIIKVMGTVDQIEDDDERGARGNESEKVNDSKRIKKLYRDGDNIILGGVCSGLAAYFSIDPIIVRLIFVALTLLNGVGILIYFIMWIIVPEAKTSVQKLEMQGEPINLNNIEELVKEKSELIKDQGKKVFIRFKDNKSSFMKILSLPIILIEAAIKFVMAILRGILPIMRIIIGFVLVFAAFIGFIITSFWTVILLFKTNSPLLQTEFPISLIADSKAYFITILSVYFAVLTPIIGVFIGAVNLLSRKRIANWTIAVILFALFTVNVTIATIFGFDLANNVKIAYEQYISENTVEKNIEISDFNAISGSAYANLIVEKSDKYSISMRGLKKDVEQIEISKEATSTSSLVNLKINGNNRYGRHGFMVVSKPVEIIIKVPYLEQLDASNFLNYRFIGFDKEPSVISRKNITIINESSGLEHECVTGSNRCKNSNECVLSIESCDSDINFSKSGVSVKELPGLNGEDLYLIYEEPGKPALRAKLEFDGQSTCGDELQNIPCMAMSVSDYGLYNGRRIKVKGIEGDGNVTVRELIYEK